MRCQFVVEFISSSGRWTRRLFGARLFVEICGKWMQLGFPYLMKLANSDAINSHTLFWYEVFSRGTVTRLWLLVPFFTFKFIKWCYIVTGSFGTYAWNQDLTVKQPCLHFVFFGCLKLIWIMTGKRKQVCTSDQFKAIPISKNIGQTR